jgi:hypothetical protein
MQCRGQCHGVTPCPAAKRWLTTAVIADALIHVSCCNSAYHRYQRRSMAAALPSVVRTLADRVLPVAHTTAARAAPLSCADRQGSLISRGTASLRQAFLPAATRLRSANRRRSAAQRLTCMAASQVHAARLV